MASAARRVLASLSRLPDHGETPTAAVGMLVNLCDGLRQPAPLRPANGIGPETCPNVQNGIAPLAIVRVPAEPDCRFSNVAPLARFAVSVSHGGIRACSSPLQARF